MIGMATPQGTIRQVLAILERGDWDALAAHPGLYETRQYFPAMLAAFPDLRHTIEQEVVSGELVATVATARGTHRGDFMGFPASGKEVNFMVLGVDRVVDGTVVEHRALPDWLALFGQLGMMIQPPAVGA